MSIYTGLPGGYVSSSSVSRTDVQVNQVERIDCKGSDRTGAIRDNRGTVSNAEEKVIFSLLLV